MSETSTPTTPTTPTPPVATERPAVHYPFAAPPPPGTTIQVAPGVHWIRLPMPFRLNHINVWALADGDGWTLVDTGLRSAETLDVWMALFQGALAGRPVRRVIATHMHPDHIGLAGWMTRHFGASFWMTRLEYLTCRMLVSDSGREAPAEAAAFCHRAGWSAAAVESYRVRFGEFGKNIHPLPDVFRRIVDGECITIGARSWQVIVGNGHSPEHACLYCAELGVFISGDQVLPKISSNVSVYPTEPEADPMGDWLATLARLEAALPPDVLVLPSHNECFVGLHTRLRVLADGQAQVLDRLRAALAQPRRVIDLFETLFGRPIGESPMHVLSLATGETVACLNYLLHRGEAWCEEDGDGIAWYRRTAKG